MTKFMAYLIAAGVLPAHYSFGANSSLGLVPRLA